MHIGPFLAVAAIVVITPGVDSLLPQFVEAHGSAGDLLLLGLLFNAMGVGWLLCYATAVARGRNVLVRPRVKCTLDRISGVVLVGLGTRLAFESR